MLNSRRAIIGCERNVVRVDFRPQPDPPAPKFPGAGALRQQPPHPEDTSLKAKVA